MTNETEQLKNTAYRLMIDNGYSPKNKTVQLVEAFADSGFGYAFVAGISAHLVSLLWMRNIAPDPIDNFFYFLNGGFAGLFFLGLVITNGELIDSYSFKFNKKRNNTVFFINKTSNPFILDTTNRYVYSPSSSSNIKINSPYGFFSFLKLKYALFVLIANISLISLVSNSWTTTFYNSGVIVVLYLIQITIFSYLCSVWSRFNINKQIMQDETVLPFTLSYQGASSISRLSLIKLFTSEIKIQGVVKGIPPSINSFYDLLKLLLVYSEKVLFKFDRNSSVYTDSIKDMDLVLSILNQTIPNTLDILENLSQQENNRKSTVLLAEARKEVINAFLSVSNTKQLISVLVSLLSALDDISRKQAASLDSVSSIELDDIAHSTQKMLNSYFLDSDALANQEIQEVADDTNRIKINMLKKRIYGDIIPRLEQLMIGANDAQSQKIKAQIAEFESFYKEEETKIIALPAPEISIEIPAPVQLDTKNRLIEEQLTSNEFYLKELKTHY